MSVVAVGLGVCMWRTIYLVVQVVCKPFGAAGYNFRPVLTGWRVSSELKVFLF